MSFRGMLTETIEIQQRANVGTDFQPIWDWDTEDDFNGLIVEMSERNKIYDEGKKLLADHKCYADYETVTTQITRQHRLKWGSNLYEVYSIKNPNQLDHHFEFKLKLLPGGFDESGS